MRGDRTAAARGLVRAMTTAPAELAGTGRALRRLGLALSVLWLLAIVLTIAGGWTRADSFARTELIAYSVSSAATRTWGWLGAAVGVYLAGVGLELRVCRPVQVRYRPRVTQHWARDRVLPVVVVAVVVATLAVAVFQQTQR